MDNLYGQPNGWKNIRSLKPSRYAISQLTRYDKSAKIRTYRDGQDLLIHGINFGRVNEDLFLVEIAKLPEKNTIFDVGNLKRYEKCRDNQAALTMFFRHNFHKLFDQSIGTANVREICAPNYLSPCNEDSLGCIIDFRINPKLPFVKKISKLFSDSGRVELDNKMTRFSIAVTDVGPYHWAVTTIYSDWGGDHPVSGTRVFGVRKLTNDRFVFYTQAVDSLTGYVEILMNFLEDVDNFSDFARKHTNNIVGNPFLLLPQPIPRYIPTIVDLEMVFSGATAIWKRMQSIVAKEITSQGGKALPGAFYSKY